MVGTADGILYNGAAVLLLCYCACCALRRSPPDINAIIAGIVYIDVEGIYLCHFTTPKNKVLSSHGTAKPAGPEGFAVWHRLHLSMCRTPSFDVCARKLIIHLPAYVVSQEVVHTCLPSVPSASVPIRSRTWMLQPPANLHRPLLCYFQSGPVGTQAPRDSNVTTQNFHLLLFI